MIEGIRSKKEGRIVIAIVIVFSFVIIVWPMSIILGITIYDHYNENEYVLDHGDSFSNPLIFEYSTGIGSKGADSMYMLEDGSVRIAVIGEDGEPGTLYHYHTKFSQQEMIDFDDNLTNLGIYKIGEGGESENFTYDKVHYLFYNSPFTKGIVEAGLMLFEDEMTDEMKYIIAYLENFINELYLELR